MADARKQKAKQAWEVAIWYSTTCFAQFIEETLNETMDKWTVMKGDREYAVPRDVEERDFWCTMNPSEWEPAVTTCLWAARKRKELSARWREIAKMVWCFNILFDRKLDWPDEELEETLEDLHYFLDPLSREGNVFLAII